MTFKIVSTAKTTNLILLFFSVLTINLQSQNTQSITIAFYNVENLFDTLHDAGKNDYEFLPDGKKNWNSIKYHDKLNNIAKTILSIDTNWQGPDVIGLCEIENRNVLNDLISQTPLVNFNYGISHYPSPDFRGIDVALLYKKEKLTLISDTAIRISDMETRDILRSDLVFKTDTFSTYVNHWSSRRGGEAQTAHKRAKQASTLKEDMRTNLIKQQIVMGDLNDSPMDASVTQHAGFSCDTSSDYYNTSCLYEGTLKHREHWQTFDQLIISQSLVNKLIESKVHRKDWLFEQDDYFGGIRTKRSFRGDLYQSGYSDHLPVYMILKF